ncbi:armadillo-type protein [Phellopilus nigrolimitatus]|nr:armadillo-type protein [Phellopilus nigrolimitatus]
MYLIDRLALGAGNEEGDTVLNLGIRPLTCRFGSLEISRSGIKSKISSMQFIEILTTVTHVRRSPRLTFSSPAINALYNSLGFVCDIFECEVNYIMQVMCEATQKPPVLVQVGAFECLVRINEPEVRRVASNAASVMSCVLCMRIFDMVLAMLAINVEKARVSRESGTVLETSTHIKSDGVGGSDDDKDDERRRATIKWRFIWTERSLAALKRTSLYIDLCKDEIELTIEATVSGVEVWRSTGDQIEQDKDADEDEWNVFSLALLAQTVADSTVPAVFLFIEALVDMTRDESLLGCEGHRRTDTRPATCSSSHSNPMSTSIRRRLDVKRHPLALYYEGIVTALSRVTDRTDNESNSCTSAYEALASYTMHTGSESITVAQNAALEQLLGMQNQFLCIDSRNNWNELQSNLCSVLIVDCSAIQSVARKLGNGIEPLANQIRTVLLGLSSYTVRRRPCLKMLSSAAPCPPALELYIQTLVLFLYPALKMRDTQLCTIIGAIGDISGALGEQSVQYAGPFMSVLLKSLSSKKLSCNVKIPILSCFGDIALAIGPGFKPYLDHTFKRRTRSHMLSSASTIAKAGDTQLCTIMISVIGNISRALDERSVQHAGPFVVTLL